MAATLSQSAFGLQAPTHDDTMEISSDFGAVDNDIDIDLDSAGEQMRYEDDDQMIDDVNHERGSYHDDDVMLDGDTASVQGDREMQDDAPVTAPAPAPAQEHDEELLDFSEDEDLYADDAPLENPDVQITEPVVEQPGPALAIPVIEEPVEQVQSETATELLNVGVGVVEDATEQHREEAQQPPQNTTLLGDEAQPPSLEDGVSDRNEPHQVDPVAQPSEHDATNSQDTVHDVSDGEGGQPDATPSNDTSSHADDATEKQSETLVEESAHERRAAVVDENNVAPQPADLEPDQAAAQPVSLTVDTEVARSGETDNPASPHAQRPSSPTVTGMHPTIVEFQGEEIYLFPSRKPIGNETFLLQNENLANTSLGDLLQACRSVLDHTLSDDDELVLGVPELDLFISEDSTPAFSTRFSELLDIYVQLHRNDGNHSPDPFVVTLKTQTRFTNRLNLITQAITEGKGFSELSFVDHHPGFPDEEDFGDEYFSEEEEQQQDPDQQDYQSNEIEQQQREDGHDNDNDDNNTDNHVSFEAASQQEELAEPVEEHPQAEDAQEESQYYESYEEVDGQVQHDEPSATSVAPEVAVEEHGEDDAINFDEEDDDSSLTTTASAEGEFDATKPETSLDNDQVTYDSGEAKAVYEVDDIPPPPEDEHFDEEEFEEESNSQEDAANEDGHKETAPAAEEYSFEDQEASASVLGASNHADVTAQSTASSTTLEAGQEDFSKNDEQTREGLGTQSSAEEQAQVDQDELDLGAEFDVPETASQDDRRETRASADPVTKDDSEKPAYDPDFIDFDDDEDFENAPAPAEEPVEAESTKDSPSTKRSYSERNEVEEISADGQALKKVRSS